GGEMKHSGCGRVRHGGEAERVKHRPGAEHGGGAITIRERAGHRLGRAPEQHLDGEREGEHVASPALGARHRSEKEAQPGTRAETDERDQATAGQDEGGGAPQARITGGGEDRLAAIRPGAARGLHWALPSLGPTPQAGTAAARTTGFSTIGRLITAESNPNRIESHHTAS